MIPCSTASPRARLDVARVAGRDRDGEPGADGRALSRPEHDALARGEIEARVVLRRRAAAGLRRAAPGGSAAPRSAELPLPLGVGDDERREAHELAPRQPRADEDALGLVAALLDRRAERVELARAARPRRTARAAAPPRTARRSGRAIRARSSSSPSPVSAEICSACGNRLASRRRASGSSRSTLLRTSSERQAPTRRSPAAPTRPRAAARRAGPRAATRRRRGEPDRRRASPRASTRTPRRAGAAGGG